MSKPAEKEDSVPFRVLAPAGDATAGNLPWPRVVCAPFAPNRLAVLEALSQAIFRHARLRRDPGGAALAFWLRRANLLTLQAEFEARATGRLVLPAGRVFHVTPANVDTMGCYSWALSFLAGNANVVRLTTRLSPVLLDLIECLAAVFAEHPAATQGNYFVTYSHDDALTERFSRECDLRMIWGGDETVRRLRSIPLNSHAGERAFASKRSLSVIAAAAYLALDAAARTQLAQRMAADLAPFNQMACSSPHVLYWLGPAPAAREAQADFLPRVEAAMAERLGEPDLGLAARRLNAAFAAAADGGVIRLEHRPHVTTVLAPPVARDDRAEPCGGGFLVCVIGRDLRELANELGMRHQTVTHFGLEQAECEAFARQAGSNGVDRVVPIGRALDFQPVWDGYDLWSDLTRTVTLQ